MALSWKLHVSAIGDRLTDSPSLYGFHHDVHSTMDYKTWYLNVLRLLCRVKFVHGDHLLIDLLRLLRMFGNRHNHSFVSVRSERGLRETERVQ